MAETQVVVEERGPVAYVRLERPAKRNALTGGMLSRLAEIFRGIAERRDLRAVILLGAGKDFCAGTDIAELAALDPDGARRKAEEGQRVCELIETCGTLVVAAVEGAAAGGGCELALACHLRVAARGALFQLPEARLGVLPAYGGTQRLARSLGPGRALASMLAGDHIDAEEAFRLGLLNRLAEAGQALAEAESLARAVEDFAAPLAVRACLEAVTAGARLPLEGGLRLEVELFSRLFSTRDAREGTRAFLEKRKPSFEGR